jgi:hypothetical protein
LHDSHTAQLQLLRPAASCLQDSVRSSRHQQVHGGSVVYPAEAAGMQHLQDAVWLALFSNAVWLLASTVDHITCP